MHTSHPSGQGPPLRPGGEEGRGEVGEMLSSDTAHLTLPSLRDGPLPLPPQAGGEGPSPATRNVQANMCACPSASAGVTRVIRSDRILLWLARVQRLVHSCGRGEGGWRACPSCTGFSTRRARCCPLPWHCAAKFIRSPSSAST